MLRGSSQILKDCSKRQQTQPGKEKRPQPRQPVLRPLARRRLSLAARDRVRLNLPASRPHPRQRSNCRDEFRYSASCGDHGRWISAFEREGSRHCGDVASGPLHGNRQRANHDSADQGSDLASQGREDHDHGLRRERPGEMAGADFDGSRPPRSRWGRSRNSFAVAMRPVPSAIPV
jgi:hypothetical protein